MICICIWGSVFVKWPVKLVAQDSKVKNKKIIIRLKKYTIKSNNVNNKITVK